MPLYLPVIQSYKGPPPFNREIQLTLHNNVYVFTSTVGTQTESEVFYMNGKPARVVHPFRVVPKKPREIVAQMAELEMQDPGQGPLPMIPVFNDPIVVSMQLATEWIPPPPEEQYQEVVAQQPEEPEQQELAEAEVPAVQERHSQETQTDMELFVEDDGTDTTASASEDSNGE